MKNVLKQIVICGIFAVILALTFAACNDGNDLNNGDPNNGDPNSGNPNGGNDPNSGDPNGGSAHTHDWGEWTGTTVSGTEMRVCKTDESHIETRLTGTDRFTFEPAGMASYRVRKGTAITGDVIIPDYYRPDADSTFLPVTEIGSMDDGWEGDDDDPIDWDNYDYGDDDYILANVTSISAPAFYDCTNLTSIAIPASVTSIGIEAFGNCTGLTSVTFAADSQLATIGEVAFYNCTNLTGIIIPASVTSIGGGAFYNCTGLTGITIGSGVTSIGYYAFEGCTNLTTVTLAEGLMSIGNSWFSGLSSLTIVNIPTSVTSIGYSAFRYCTGLTAISIPASVTSINGAAFSGCTSLTSITVNANNPNYASESGILYNKAKTTLIQAPGGISGSVTIPDSVTSIGYGAFSGCTGLTSITIPASVTTIGEGAFFACTGFTSITIPDSVTEIGESAFSDCTGLTDITIPSDITSIGQNAFAGCRALTSVTFETGSAITSENFGTNAFPEEWYGNSGNKLKTAYLAGGAGTYTRVNGGSTWTKQGGGDPNPDTGGTFTVTDIPSEYNGKYALFSGDNEALDLRLNGYQSFNKTTVVITLVQIANGSVSLPMWIYDVAGEELVRYSGNNTVEGFLEIIDSATVGDHSVAIIDIRYWDSITFSNGSAQRTWDSGDEYY